MRAETSCFYSAERLILDVSDGDDIGWDAEFRWLWEHDWGRMCYVMQSVIRNGFEQPIEIGLNPVTGEMRMWDGHHRLGIALALCIPIPVKFVEVEGKP